MNELPHVTVAVHANYLAQQSSDEVSEYVFRYVVTITNMSSIAVQLLQRYWLIIDALEQRKEVQGQGVLGQQPHIAPGKSFQYASFVMLNTPMGTMQGHYSMVDQHHRTFDVPIAPFMLANPCKLQ